MNRQTMR